jgi:hypothetical protein
MVQQVGTWFKSTEMRQTTGKQGASESSMSSATSTCGTSRLEKALGAQLKVLAIDQRNQATQR